MMNERGRQGRGGVSRSLAKPFPLRLYTDQKLEYERRAKLVGRSLTAYIRDRLDAEDPVLEVLEGMLDALREIEQRLDGLESGGGKAAAGSDAIGVETLMLLRQLLIASNRKKDIDMVKGEIKRHGLTPWEPKD